tara:strand:+ start:97 stop:411 length:315 start_codon:yes stop_codon:yes gene_type:complete
MGQRINIQYSVDIDNLGEEIERLLRGSFEKIADLQSYCVIPQDALSLKTLDNVEEMRQKLLSIDSSLRDIVYITSGYVSFQAELAKQQNETERHMPEEIDEVTD